MKTTIWYEFTDKEDVQTLRDAAAKLEKTGRVMLLLTNVELDDPPVAVAGGAGGSNWSGGGSAGGSGTGGWNASGFASVGAAGSSVSYGAGGGGCSLPPDHKGPCRST